MCILVGSLRIVCFEQKIMHTHLKVDNPWQKGVHAFITSVDIMNTVFRRINAPGAEAQNKPLTLSDSNEID